MSETLVDDTFATSIIEGLSDTPKRIAAKWLYDAEGSRLFGRITALDAYYPTRTERAILTDNAAAIAQAIGPDAVLFEPGAGTGEKAAILLAALERPALYLPADINAGHLRGALDGLPVPVRPLAMDFTQSLRLPSDVEGPVTAFFPGSTIGNFEPADARDLLARMRTEAGAQALVIGFDLVKDPEILERAYDDPEGVTAAFNLNLLERINRELDANFAPAAFTHVALFNDEHARIEMHLESQRDQEVRIAGRRFAFRQGERIRTEHCYKYTIARFAERAEAAGWTLQEAWTDASDLFAVAFLTADAAP